MRAVVFSKLFGIIGLVSLCLAPVGSAEGKSLYVLYSGINANFLSLWMKLHALTGVVSHRSSSACPASSAPCIRT